MRVYATRVRISTLCAMPVPTPYRISTLCAMSVPTPYNIR